MNIDMSHIAPYIWIVAAVVVAFVIFIVIRFFWQHVLRYLFHGCVAIVRSLFYWRSCIILKYSRVQIPGKSPFLFSLERKASPLITR